MSEPEAPPNSPAAPESETPETAATESAAPKVDIDAVKAVLERIRPFLQSDGGDLEFVELDGTSVTIRLQGACVGCPSSIYTLKLGIENQLKEEVPGLTEVIAIS